MSVSIKYKGAEIASASTEVTKTIKTAGKYCEADILVENTPDGGDAPVINPLSVTANGTYTAPSGVDGYSPVTVNVPQGITPTGNINITDTNVTDVTQYATAQVVDADLVASNIKEGVNILGVLGTFAGGGGSLPSSISKIDGGSLVFTSETVSTYQIAHNLGETPKGAYIYTNDAVSAVSYLIVSACLITGQVSGTTKVGRTIIEGSGYVDGLDVSAYLNEVLTPTFFSIYHGAKRYQSNVTYYWVVWA